MNSRKQLAKLFSALISLATLGVIVVIINGLLAGNFKGTTALSSSLEPTPTVKKLSNGWNRHEDVKNGFAINYPPSWTVQTELDKGLGYSFQSSDLQTDQVGQVKSGACIRVTIVPNSENKSVRDWVAENSERSGVKRLSLPIITNFAGTEATVFDQNISLFGKAHTAVISGNAKLFRFDLFTADSVEQTARSNFELMLASLQFLP